MLLSNRYLFLLCLTFEPNTLHRDHVMGIYFEEYWLNILNSSQEVQWLFWSVYLQETHCDISNIRLNINTHQEKIVISFIKHKIKYKYTSMINNLMSFKESAFQSWQFLSAGNRNYRYESSKTETQLAGNINAISLHCLLCLVYNFKTDNSYWLAIEMTSMKASLDLR